MMRNMIKQKKRKSRGAQSTVEYIVMFSGLIVAVLIFMRTGGLFDSAYTTTLTTGTNSMMNMSNRLFNR